jgi:hypothetical protein
MTDSNLRITVKDRSGKEHFFLSTGLHEDYEYQANIYTSELMVSRVKYGPRGTDEWARQSSTVVAAWPAGQWVSVTQNA